MPSLVVHYAFVGLLAATVLGAAFDKRSLLLALVVVTVPDIDAFMGLVSIVAIENQCTPDRTTAVRSVCKSFQLLL